MFVQLKQIQAVYVPTPAGGGYVNLFALDEEGQLWQWMKGKWGKMKNPDLKKNK